MSPNAGGGGYGASANEYSRQLCTWSPDKLCRSNSIFNLWLNPLERNHVSELHEGNPFLYFYEGSPVLDPQAGDPALDLAWVWGYMTGTMIS
jgi:hypothetical protein